MIKRIEKIALIVIPPITFVFGPALGLSQNPSDIDMATFEHERGF
jgi:hypothetical protein